MIFGHIDFVRCQPSGPLWHSGPKCQFDGHWPRYGANIGLTMGFYVVWRRFMIVNEKKLKNVNFDVCQAQKPKFLDFPKMAPNDF